MLYMYRRSTRLVHVPVQGVAVSDRTILGIYASKYYGVSLT